MNHLNFIQHTRCSLEDVVLEENKQDNGFKSPCFHLKWAEIVLSRTSAFENWSGFNFLLKQQIPNPTKKKKMTLKNEINEEKFLAL